MRHGVVVIDFGGQYAHLIANRVRRLRVYAEIRSPEAKIHEIRGAQGLILSGGPASVYDPDRPFFSSELLRMGLPVLGLCYGHQLICQTFGGEVKPGSIKEYGTAELAVQSKAGPLRGLKDVEQVWMSHGDSVARLPSGFKVLGSTPDCPVAAMGDIQRKVYGLQFHPEVTHTPSGMKILSNFLDECGCARDWTMMGFVGRAISEIQERVGDRQVFLLVSGGVDSTVAFALLNRALGSDRVYGLHIDNGFMRKNETKLVKRYLEEEGFDNFHVVDASREFLKATKGIVDPEAKRRVVGTMFVHVVDRAIAELHLSPDKWMLGQGTLYTDTIESGGTRNSARIKTHHNRVQVIEELMAQGRVVEPLAELYKDEVRELGMELGLPRRLVWRHPFPGPGLSVRALCSREEEDLTEVKEIEGQVEEIVREFGLASKVLPVRSVGVQGDFRTYAHPAALIGEGDWSTLERISTAITNRVRQINRVVYLVAPETIPAQSLKGCSLTEERLDLLREADHIVMSALDESELLDQITQIPTVLLPLSSDGIKESLVLRPVYTEDFMTVRFSDLPMDLVRNITEKLLRLEGIEAVFYDVTHKPPGTLEWE